MVFVKLVDGEIIDNDLDNDGICDADEIGGCQDETACNYESLATDDDGSCEYTELYLIVMEFVWLTPMEMGYVMS